MTSSSKKTFHSSAFHSSAFPSFGEPTTAVPDFGGELLPELSTPQERYDHGYKRGYMAGYAEGARAAEAERAADLAVQKTAWAAQEARADALLLRLASATEQYARDFGGRDLALTEALLLSAFDLAEAVVGREIKTTPALALEVARSALSELPTGPAVVRVNPADRQMVEEAAERTRRAGEHLTILAGPEVGPGGCIVTSGAKTADARIEEALARARVALLSEAAPAEAGTGGEGAR